MRPIAAPPGAWVCPGCGFPNLPTDVACYVCHRLAREAVLPPDGAPETPYRGPLPTTSWLLRFSTALAAIVLAIGLGFGVWALALRHSEQALSADVAVTAAPSTQGEQPPTPRPDQSDAPGTHTVRTGDSLYSIAAHFGVTEQELDYWNLPRYPTLLHQPRAIVVGWVLLVYGPPIPTPTPRPTPVPTPVPTFPTIPNVVAKYLGGVTLRYYEIYGDTPNGLIASINTNGPSSNWMGRAEGLTEAKSGQDYEYVAAYDGSCLVEITGQPPFTFAFTVTLPHWAPPAGVPASTVTWWTSELERVARHEAHHVALYRNALPSLNDAVATQTCSQLNATIDGAFADLHYQNCLFDMQEYGYAMGLSIESCLAS